MLDGQISIHRTTSNRRDEEFVRLEVRDPVSSTTFVVGTMTLKDFAQVVLGVGHMPIELDVRHLDRVGKRREIKHELVLVPTLPWTASTQERASVIRSAVSAFEVDGWIGDDNDADDHRHRAQDGGVEGDYYRVCYQRWVDA